MTEAATTPRGAIDPDQQALLPGQVVAPGGERDRQRPHDGQHDEHEGELAPAELGEVLEPQAGSQHDEDAGDQEHRQVLLEPPDLADAAHVAGVADDNAEHRGGDEARLLEHEVVEPEHQEGGAEDHRGFQEARHPAAAKGEPERPPHPEPERHGDDKGEAEAEQHLPEQPGLPGEPALCLRQAEARRA